uniref:Uncharacterized protein n=1 Tax=Mycena chlorophos TaxID=658473 RepID=A0ABQ0LH72_MYCCL|nr:predicted protein [Mycena chlorophos]
MSTTCTHTQLYSAVKRRSNTEKYSTSSASTRRSSKWTSKSSLSSNLKAKHTLAVSKSYPPALVSSGQIKILLRKTSISVPRTSAGAHQLIHVFTARRGRYSTEHAAAQSRLHEIVEHLNVVRNEVDRIGSELEVADGELNTVLEWVRTSGGFATAGSECSLCSSPVPQLHSTPLIDKVFKDSADQPLTVSLRGVAFSVERTLKDVHEVMHYARQRHEVCAKDQTVAIQRLQKLINHRTRLELQEVGAANNLRMANRDLDKVLTLVGEYGLCVADTSCAICCGEPLTHSSP